MTTLSDDSLMRELARLGALLDRAVRQQRRAGCVAPAALVFLSNHESARADGVASRPLTQVELAGMLGIRPQSVGTLLADLEREGLVRRTRCAHDRRAHEVELTDEGRARVAQTRAEDRALAERTLSVLTNEEKTQLANAVLKLSAGLDRG